MTSTPGTAARLSRLLAEIRVDRDALAVRGKDIAERLGRTADRGPSRDEILVLAMNLHGWYTALETLLERVARLLDESVPTGSSWHAELLDQMGVEVAGLRPAVLDRANRVDFSELRKFRHFFRNAYVFNFDAARVLSHAERVSRVEPSTLAGIARLEAHLVAVLAELAVS
ncbi:MAG TPA: hypothetical protein VHC69_35515 [Polyangiaceae bacterium]|nr:hypothetical protein [Polyangiaceae bacterium]